LCLQLPKKFGAIQLGSLVEIGYNLVIH
jgi:hypothetical protein